MIKIKPRYIITILAVSILVLGSYTGWQIFNGKRFDPASQAVDSPTTKNVSSSYKKVMSSTYQQTLQAMQSVKNNTLALQKKNITLDAYKACILQAQATFSSAETFVQANPPTEERLKASYQEFLAGISLAKESMNVVLDGISFLNPSSFFTALEMGRNAKQQVLNAYASF